MACGYAYITLQVPEIYLYALAVPVLVTNIIAWLYRRPATLARLRDVGKSGAWAIVFDLSGLAMYGLLAAACYRTRRSHGDLMFFMSNIFAGMILLFPVLAFSRYVGGFLRRPSVAAGAVAMPQGFFSRLSGRLSKTEYALASGLEVFGSLFLALAASLVLAWVSGKGQWALVAALTVLAVIVILMQIHISQLMIRRLHDRNIGAIYAAPVILWRFTVAITLATLVITQFHSGGGSVLQAWEAFVGDIGNLANQYPAFVWALFAGTLYTTVLSFVLMGKGTPGPNRFGPAPQA